MKDEPKKKVHQADVHMEMEKIKVICHRGAGLQALSLTQQAPQPGKMCERIRSVAVRSQ